MKRINEEVDLTGRLEKITMMDLRRRPGEVLDLVMLGKIFILTRSGKNIAVISRLPGEQLSMVINGKGEIDYTR